MLGLYGNDYINDHVNTGEGRHGERTETVEPRGQKAEAGENAKEGRRDRSGKVAKEVVLGDRLRSR